MPVIYLNGPAKSHGFDVGPTVLKQISWSHGSLRKSHGKLKNGKKMKNI